MSSTYEHVTSTFLMGNSLYAKCGTTSKVHALLGQLKNVCSKIINDPLIFYASLRLPAKDVLT